jgi:putative DNA primase/helicase
MNPTEPYGWSSPSRDLAAGISPYSELAIAHLFADIFGPDVRYCAEHGAWYWWDYGTWRRDVSLHVRSKVQEVCASKAGEAREDPTIDRPGAREILSRLIGSTRTVNGVEVAARAIEPLKMSTDVLDRDPWVLNTPGGLVDLRKGSIRPTRREDWCTRCASVTPDFEAECPEFERFMREITCDDLDLIDWLQVLLGMLLTGDIRLHLLPVIYGEGRNGKNTLFDLVLWIMGDYATKIPSSLLMTDRHGNRHPTEIAQLAGVRLALGSEISQGSFLDDAKLKELTGDEMLTARFMRGDFFTFQRTHRFVLLGNYRPQIKVIDPAIKSRIRLVPFRANFSGREDRDLPARLRDEAGAILAWIIDGARAWSDDPCLPACHAVDGETREYFESQSTVDNWIDVELDSTDTDARSWMRDLYPAYKAWKESRGEHPTSQTTMAQVLGRRFKKGTSNGTYYLGVRLKPRAANPDELAL